MARGWYGLNVGDKVIYKSGMVEIKGEIFQLHPRNKNSAIMLTEDKKHIEVVCEWCKKIEE